MVLTPSRQLAHAVRVEYARHAQQQGRKAWPTPSALPWSAWLRTQWVERRGEQRGQATEQLLTSFQARALWEQVVTQSEQAAELLDLSSAAETAARSWQRLHDYLIPLERLVEFTSAEAHALHTWATRFRERCAELHAIDDAQLAERAHQQQWLPRQPATLIGFDTLVPAMQRLVDAWQAHGRCVAPAARGSAAQVRVFAAADARAELEIAARWARSRLEQGCASVGIVVNDLDARRREVVRTFEDVCAPGNAAIGAAQLAVPVVVAAPEPLSGYASIDAALLCLRLLAGNASSVVVGRLLRSPFLAAGLSEQDARALADVRLREEQRDVWDLPLLERWAAMNNCAQLQLRAGRAVTRARALPSRQMPSQWAEAFHAVLTELGWPGERTLSSAEYQTERKFHAALSDLGALDAVLGPVSLSMALGRLTAIANDTAFEPEAQPAAISVVDLQSAAGLQFEALWVMGLDAARLPGAVDPDSLIPLELQRAARMPQAAAQQWLELAQLRLRRLTTSASQVILSWPQTDGDAQLQASALLAPWPVLTIAQLRQATSRARARQLFEERPPLERYVDERAPRLASSSARGGALILELQSRCPFRAQAELRLAARPLARMNLGIGARERGLLLHRVLEQLWRELGSQAQLATLAPERLVERVRELAQQHAPGLLKVHTPLRARLLQVEMDYVVQQTLALLDIERVREPFALRFAEQGGRLAIGGLDISLQPDRIDRLQAGGELLLDYKLGESHNPGQWLDVRPGRPRRPQLPLYALANAEHTQALAFVVLAPGRVEFRGWSGAPSGTPGIDLYPPPRRGRLQGPPDWPSLLAHWQRTLTQLAEQFVAGQAAVDPLPLECSTCHLRSFCRIHEHALPQQYDLDFDDE